MKDILVKAPAKVNIVLNVGRKIDKLHLLRSIMLKIDLFDELRSVVEGKDLEIISNISYEENLISRSYNLLKENESQIDGLKIYLDKKIPSGGGLGGGSSDSACALSTMNKLFNLNISTDKMMEYGLNIGSDVCFFILGKNAMISHFGEVITPINIGHLPEIIVSWSDEGTDTKSIYDRFDEMDCKSNMPDGFTWGRFIYSIEKGDIESIEALMFNDLELCILKDRDDIIQIKEIMKKEGIRCVMMSGSGSSVFGFSEDRKITENTAKILENEGYGIHIGRIIR